MEPLSQKQKDYLEQLKEDLVGLEFYRRRSITDEKATELVVRMHQLLKFRGEPIVAHLSSPGAIGLICLIVKSWSAQSSVWSEKPTINARSLNKLFDQWNVPKQPYFDEICRFFSQYDMSIFGSLESNPTKLTKYYWNYDEEYRRVMKMTWAERYRNDETRIEAEQLLDKVSEIEKLTLLIDDFSDLYWPLHRLSQQQLQLQMTIPKSDMKPAMVDSAFWVGSHIYTQSLANHLRTLAHSFIGRTEELSAIYRPMKQLTEAGYFWSPMAKGLSILFKVPLFMDTVQNPQTEQRVYHNEGGPCAAFSNGEVLYAIEGVAVKSNWIENPETITVEDIETTPNTEIRAFLLSQYGIQDYLTDGGFAKIQSDDYGTLWHAKRLRKAPIAYVAVVNATADSGGNYKDYLLRADPKIKTAQEAVARSFGVTVDQYQPVAQS